MWKDAQNLRRFQQLLEKSAAANFQEMLHVYLKFFLFKRRLIKCFPYFEFKTKGTAAKMSSIAQVRLISSLFKKAEPLILRGTKIRVTNALFEHKEFAIENALKKRCTSLKSYPRRNIESIISYF